MKKLVLVFACLILSMPCYAKGIPYITSIPYKPYNKEITLNKINSQSIEDNKILITKNKYDFDKAKLLGKAYEYVILNNTNSDIVLKGVLAKEFFNRDINGDRNNLYKNMMNVAASDCWRAIIPIYAQVYAAQIDIEKNPFIRCFPKEYQVKNGETIRILSSAPLDIDNPQANFIFQINDKEQIIKF